MRSTGKLGAILNTGRVLSQFIVLVEAGASGFRFLPGPALHHADVARIDIAAAHQEVHEDAGGGRAGGR